MPKSPETRKEELLAAAEALFRKNGVDCTAVSDIVREAHVSQGTFYNYFQSKDEIFAAVLEQATSDMMEEMRKTGERTDLDPLRKLDLLYLLDFQMNRSNDSLFDVLHESRYADAHQKYIVARIEKLRPIYAKVIRQGVEQGVFHTSYPDEAAHFLLTAIKFVFDPAFFQYSEEGMIRMGQAVGDFCERVLGAPQDAGSHGREEWTQSIEKYLRRNQHESGL
jgi:AcrR family transcriptional regulator